jgi:hypothetical protein
MPALSVWTLLLIKLICQRMPSLMRIPSLPRIRPLHNSLPRSMLKVMLLFFFLFQYLFTIHFLLSLGVQIYLYSPIARIDRNRVDVQVQVSNPQRIGFAKNQFKMPKLKIP